MSITMFVFFLAIVIGTLLITYWAARQTTSTSDYYAAGGQLTGFQNGLAIAGDYMSAASFLGITGVIALYGFDGYFYSIGFLVSYLVLLLLIAEPIRHLGKFTMGDVIAARFPSRWIRTLTSFSTLFISVLYMVAQLIAAGALLKLLLGVRYDVSVLIVGILMTIYVVFGGMMATSWVQIIKTILLVTGSFMLCLIVLSRYEWSIFSIFQAVEQASPLQERFLQPGNLFTDPLDTLSLNLALVLGTAGLPHILIRFLTVKDALAVRKSVISATFIIGLFYLMTIILGFGATLIVGWDHILSIDDSGNMAAPLLAFFLGGDFLVAFVSAIAFATILAVVSGVIISASSSIAHDFYRHVLHKGQASEERQMRVAKIAAILVGMIAIVISIKAQNFNVAALVSLIFSIAASVHFPLLLLTIYWRKFTLAGALSGMIVGLILTTLLVFFGPVVMNPVNGIINREAIFPLQNPGIVSIPCSFLVAVFVSLFTASPLDEHHFRHVSFQAHTGRRYSESVQQK
ncbi:solute symporter family protein [Caldalkalibacillus mannanilyticus]|uniref:solute symporter family protein n=1 Tax=Caldalkalibacillus mannanilyticus TaxID=1418 RepID=UPI000468F3C8|nr:cation acetate symporter [Caldalkalibacillus mannanilyticus]